MWRDFFGPQARIIGVEFNPDAKRWESDGFEIHIGDQSDVEFWKDFYNKTGPVDIILDDGGHSNEQQIVTVAQSASHINDGGVIIVEDTHNSRTIDCYFPICNHLHHHPFGYGLCV